ncbi:MAG: protein kinase domain-containing protein [Gemmatimonadales bacterium]
MPDLVSRLQTAVAGRYAVERELGQGGMATVFLARDLRHKRPVAIKVLAPEIARNIGPERFVREIEIAAGLTHPHILPVFDSGEADGLLYYVMPYVAGESLRHRLQRDHRLPVDDAVRIGREVADALDYAHRRGFVHRDIKPENVLLEEGHAIVADFGVARALAAAGEQRLTGTGLAIGTPQYMSPEQSTGDSVLDGRSDLYALGCVTFEMLAGRPVFEGPSPISLVQKHLTEAPQPLATMRPDVPAGVAAAVERALAKEPEARFATAAEFGAALTEGVMTPASGVRRFPRLHRWTLAVGALAAAAVVAALLLARPGGTPRLDPNVVAVAPFDVLVPGLEVWREGLVDVVSRDLDGAGPLRAVAPTVVVRRWRGRADATAAADLGHATGAGLAVFGQVVGTGGDSVRLSATLYDVAAARALGEFQVPDVSDRMDRLADSLAMRLLRELGRTRPIGAVRLTSLRSTSLPALKAFLQGEQYYRRTDWDSAIAYYERAIALDSTFALALHRMAVAAGWQRAGFDSLSRALNLRAGALNRGLAPRDSLLVAADSLSAVLYTKDADSLWYTHARRLFATLTEATRRYPDDPEVWYALGDARFHFGYAPEVGASTLDAFDRAIALDSAFGPSYIHPVDLALNLGGATLAQRYIRPYLALDPKDINARGIRFIAALIDPARLRSDEGRRLIDTIPADVVRHALAGGLARWADTAETALRILEARRARGDSTAFFGFGLRGFHSAILAYRGHLREAAEMAPPELAGYVLLLRGLVGAAPPDSIDAAFAEWGRTGNPGVRYALPWWASRGDTARVRAAVRIADSLSRHPPWPPLRPIMAYFAGASHAYLALARRDTTEALRRLMALPDSLCASGACYQVKLTRAQLLAAAGRDREAALLLDRQPSTFIEPAHVFRQLERGRVHERLGNRATAIEAYRFVADVWIHADPELQPFVEEAKAGLKRLGGEPRG